jgi:hypothetical protein
MPELAALDAPQVWAHMAIEVVDGHAEGLGGFGARERDAGRLALAAHCIHFPRHSKQRPPSHEGAARHSGQVFGDRSGVNTSLALSQRFSPWEPGPRMSLTVALTASGLLIVDPELDKADSLTLALEIELADIARI